MELIIKIIDWFKNTFLQRWLTNRENRTQRKFEFYEKQLRELYSPLVSVRKEIEILSEFRCEAEQASNKWWQDVCKTGQQIEDPDKAKKYYDQKGEGISTQIEYENRQLREKLIPAYQKMVEIVKENYWLAEEETKKSFPTLVKFVETWERHLSRTHPREVLQEIKIPEAELKSFYQHIEDTLNALKGKLNRSHK